MTDGSDIGTGLLPIDQLPVAAAMVTRIDGHELSRRLRADGAADLVIVLMSGDTSPGAEHAALAAGADLFVTKPAALADLAAVLRHERI